MEPLTLGAVAALVSLQFVLHVANEKVIDLVPPLRRFTRAESTRENTTTVVDAVNGRLSHEMRKINHDLVATIKAEVNTIAMRPAAAGAAGSASEDVPL